MKPKLILLVLLALAACAPPPPTLVPIDTIIVQTMAALTVTAPPTPVPTETPVPTDTPAPTGSTVETIPAPQGALTAPGAQCVPEGAERMQARVTRVLDGDTIEVAIGNDVHTVQYIGVDAPETAPDLEWQGPEAIAENRRLVGSQVVTLVADTPDTDQEGNWLRYVIAGNVFVNYDMIRHGFASAAELPADTACQDTFLAAEQDAQTAVVGMWAPTPTPTRTATPTPTLTLTPTLTPEFSPTPTGPPPCDCTASGVSCNSFTRQEAAQACFDYCKAEGFGDVFGLDKNNNGRACEGSP